MNEWLRASGSLVTLSLLSQEAFAEKTRYLGIWLLEGP